MNVHRLDDTAYDSREYSSLNRLLLRHADRVPWLHAAREGVCLGSAPAAVAAGRGLRAPETP